MVVKAEKVSHSISEATEYASPLTMGVDSGSLTGKAVIVDGNKRIVAHSVVQLEFVSEKAVRTAMNNVLASAGLEMTQIAYIVSTGYGRRKLDFADKTITEITCHARGANYLYPEGRTVIDIGGQDSKVIGVDIHGNTKNFAMNDRCAAGTGQFLEVMARALGVKLEEIGDLSLQATKKLTISSLCTVFAETEVVSLVAQDNKQTDILAAIHESIARRVSGLVGRVGLIAPVIMTGGVAKNIGMVRALEKELGVSIFVPDEPQIIGALGAALFARDYASNG